MTPLLRRWWGSISLRLTFQFGLLGLLAMLLALLTVYVQTVGVVYQTTQRQVEVRAQLLIARLNQEGLAGAAEDIEWALTDRLYSDQDLYLLLDPAGRAIAGNVEYAPQATRSAGRGVRTELMRDDELLTAYLVAHTTPEGAWLVVGRTLREVESIETLVREASGNALLVALVLIIGCGFMFRRAIDKSIAAVRQTAARVMAGNLRERVALSEQDDEFALLNRDINAMLDRIESLMEGVRNVSDSIAHNTRTPLTRIMLRLRAALGADLPADALRREIDEAVHELEALTVTFEKLLQLAETEAGTRRRHFTAVALHTLADDVVELYDAVAENAEVTLRRDPSEPVQLQGDPDLLSGAIANLVDNALKYAGTGAVVRVGTRMAGHEAVLTVQDNGPGVPEDEHARIGTRFHRLDRNTPGHGLGLASVKAVVSLHGGQFRTSDAAPGLRIEIRLPIHGE